jgi:6-phosphogluconolactonase
MSRIQVFAIPFALAEQAARLFVSTASEAIIRQGYFAVALAGGSTPQALYRLLVQPPYIDQIDWSKVHLFWGDERCVAPDHPDSNYRMVHQTMVTHLLIPDQNIHRIPGEVTPEIGAQIYAGELHSFFNQVDLPRFDLVLLGLGEDGHTASLFPGSKSLLENSAWVVADEHLVPPPPFGYRLTLTLPVINAAAQIIFLVSGSAKADCLRKVFTKESNPLVLPAQLVQPTNGELLWLVDQDAAKFITKF